MAAKTSHLPIALIVDLVLVVLFGIIGHYTHSHDFEPTGMVSSAWPFLTGLVAAWVLTAVWDRPLSPLSSGTGIWAVTVLLGLLLRALTGAGGEPGVIPVSFLVVATTLNFITLVGWRVVATAVSGGSRTRPRRR